MKKEANSPPAPGPSPEHALENQQVRDALRDAVARLPLELGELYALRTQGMSYAEMADVLRRPLGTVKSRMHERVKQLREEMHP
ncbi:MULTISPECIES: RNA polymerase sigma factor [unclassified Corallococcus]|uniref:RNA polymerase sigma factor n=1 Tax=unclassified Corallococcus TaxID=2685029 RepID=UPI001A8DB435|nr:MULTISPECIES: sigma factor-like helix-turn-helix DNA-binding protein [unclassified Corallococcus]MBN9686420.1 hypothetical protein [Corallococcus sp. NCSPR001]WAS82152.1 sigma factor-like helix-turn-helix DNA-binding protein [Corallococcus sp. NCRR]